MNIRHVRNATLILDYAGKRFLIDPMLGEKGSFPPFPNAPRDDQNNPLVELPMSVDEIISNVDAIFLTHLHLDHFDEAAHQLLPKDIQIYTQNEEDVEEVKKAGFKNVDALDKTNDIQGVTVYKTPAQHGRGEILEITGHVCGFIFKSNDEPTLYVAGDTVWYSDVEDTIDEYKPDVIVVNAGDNQFNEGGPLVMNAEDVYNVAKVAPNATIIATHMEAVNHWMLSREELRQFAEAHQFDKQLRIPNDGDHYQF
ncbi:metallo-beta-lactamase superfamily protein [Staphylococcus petrasii]|uniref:MBL fold metallo-hydrolase n=1 Tax=Staphylococcus petrasii TaxID=1276936 RepID=A0A380G341_9STAP|nr:MBL fold metallo-hydrolase [Staphylococcus petrasii]PNZ32029.1 hypothetical protein CD137_01620 [Staphylococcus petrasii]TGE13011.1 MBL fold metallo-hydrolase [Staphylococcus petrasii]TGE18799.1 MBL fold metallo-hydrolase [Staphylococcus petrasii]SUM44896.1 metallo-beta-lactamase superfamily protein [Staphylococcus petrasii]